MSVPKRLDEVFGGIGKSVLWDEDRFFFRGDVDLDGAIGFQTPSIKLVSICAFLEVEIGLLVELPGCIRHLCDAEVVLSATQV